MVNGQYCFSTLVKPEMERKKSMKERKRQGMMSSHKTSPFLGARAWVFTGISAPTLAGMRFILYPPSTSTHCHTTTGYRRTTAIHLQRFLKGFCSGVTGLDVEDVFPLENNHLISQRCISQRSSRHGGLENALLQVVI